MIRQNPTAEGKFTSTGGTTFLVKDGWVEIVREDQPICRVPLFDLAELHFRMAMDWSDEPSGNPATELAHLSTANRGWRLVHSDALPDGTPVAPGTTLYAFYGAPEGAHWEYDIPDVPNMGGRFSG